MCKNTITMSLFCLLMFHMLLASEEKTFPCDRISFHSPAMIDSLCQGDTFAYKIDGFVYIISPGGHVKIIGQNNKTGNLKLSVSSNCMGIIYHYAIMNSKLILIYEENCGGDSEGYITMLNALTYEKYWENGGIAFNIGEPLLCDNHVYLTGIGFIAKLNLGTGKYVWKYDDLYESGSQYFAGFKKPKRDGMKIIFEEDVSGSRKRKPNKIVVDDTTGKIVK